ncbi:MAG: MarR family transcriptional regulator [Rhizorhabdus sp.]
MNERDAPQSSAGKARQRPFSADEVGRFFGALASARDQFGQITKELSRKYGIGPRGPWMVGLIGREPASPHQLATFYGIGRSLVTAELRQLQEAGLITYKKSETDGRKVQLSLTPLGDELRNELTNGLAHLMAERLDGYSNQEVMTCARLLSDFARGNQYAQLPRDDTPSS